MKMSYYKVLQFYYKVHGVRKRMLRGADTFGIPSLYRLSTNAQSRNNKDLPERGIHRVQELDHVRVREHVETNPHARGLA